MHLESQILKEHSKRNTVRIARWIGADKKRFRQLMNLFLNGEYRVAQRSAWIVSHCADKHPALLSPFLDMMIDRMLEPGVHGAVKRNVVRLLQNREIPKELTGKVATVCFDLLASQQEPIAVRCFSMTVLANISRYEPDIRNELRLTIEHNMPWSTAGFHARGKKILKQLNTPCP
jgi:hypothetical protein